MKLLATLLLAVGTAAYGQTNTNSTVNDKIPFLDGLGSITNWSVTPYFTYAKDAPTKYGAGVVIWYNLNQNIATGVGIDWLGQFNQFSGNLTLKVPTHPLTWTGVSLLKDITATPFVIGGIATPLSGAGTANGHISGVGGVGMSFGLYHNQKSGIDIGAGYALVTWTDAGPYSGKHDEIFLSLSKKF